MPFETLSLEGMNIDSVEWSISELTADYGEGYGDAVLTGAAAGLHRWALSAGVLPDDADYGSLISGDPRFEYYFSFFKARKAEGDGVFIVEWRGLNWHASFVGPSISFEQFTSDLFAGGVEIRQRRVVGESYEADGSITP